MNGFQSLTLGFIALLIVWTLRNALGGHVRRRITVFWLAIWASAGVALVRPETTVLVARALGIGRGTDLVRKRHQKNCKQ